MTIVGEGPLHGFKVAGRSEEEISTVAMGLRSALRVTGPIFDAEQTLELLSTHGITLDVLDDDDPHLPPGVEACWIPDIPTLIIRISVYKAACAKKPRALFTVAHELGHLALGHRRTFNTSRSTRIKVYEDSEWQANSFAGAFLMPLSLVKFHNVTNHHDMRTTFGVSTQAAKTRLDKLRRKGLL